jgi:hypothetical protein
MISPLRWIHHRRAPIALGFLSCMLLWVALVVVQHRTANRRISETKAAALSSEVGWDPTSMWNQSSFLERLTFSPRIVRYPRYLQRGIILAEEPAASKKILRRATLSVTVTKPSQALDNIQAVAQSAGGFVVSSTKSGDDVDDVSATLMIRVPAPRLDSVLAEIRRIVVRVNSEQIEAKDVTKDYSDLEASIRNLQAEEAQYLSILRQARSVSDILEVSAKTNEVRGQIEKLQGELRYLEHDIEMSSVSVDLQRDADSRLLGIYWRPWHQVKVAFRGGVQGIAEYANSMIMFVFWLPTLLLWLTTMALFLWIGFRAILWIKRRLTPSTL